MGDSGRQARRAQLKRCGGGVNWGVLVMTNWLERCGVARLLPMQYRALLALALLAATAPAPVLAQTYDCAVRRACTAMQTCAEASYALEVCGDSKRDQDRDGIPCETLCSGSRALYEARVRAEFGVYPIPPNAPQRPVSLTGVDRPTVQCEGKTRCTQMMSCDEAKFNVESCRDSSFSRRYQKSGKVPCRSTLCRGAD